MTTLLLLLPLLALVRASADPRREVVESISVDNGMDRGDWGQIEFCPSGSKVIGFEIKYAATGHVDDTSVNAIRLYCNGADGSLAAITSAEGSFGEWMGLRTCPSAETATAFQANVVPYMGTFGDDLGVDNLRLRCSGGTVLDGLYGTPVSGQAKEPLVAGLRGEQQVEAVPLRLGHSGPTRDLGEWGSWAACSEGNHICGLQVRLEDEHVLDDDAGITDAIMFCCTASTS